MYKKFEAFGWHAVRCDGHDLVALARTLKEFRGVTDRPKVLVAETIKGRGVSFMESLRPGEKYYRFHSGAPDDQTYARALEELISSANALLAEMELAPVRACPRNPAPAGTVRRALSGSSLPTPARSCPQAERNSKIVALDGDLVLDTGLIPFSERFPERFIECGIAEQDMVSQAGGLALSGLLPVVHLFACFLSTRPNEQIYNNATERRRIIYVGSLAGLLPGGPGHSHQSVRDIAALGATPGLEMIQPSCEEEVAQAVEYCMEAALASCYLRLVSVPWPVPFSLPVGYRLDRGRGVAITQGEDAILFAYGPEMLSQAYLAAERLRERMGIHLAVVNLPWLNVVDDEWLAGVLARVDQVFTLDDHYVDGGQGQLIASRIAQLGLSHPVIVRQFGIREIPACGQNDEVLRAHRLDAESLADDMAMVLTAGPAA